MVADFLTDGGQSAEQVAASLGGFLGAATSTLEIAIYDLKLEGASAEMLRRTREAAERIAREEGVSVEWERIWRIDPAPFDPALMELAEEAVEEVAGRSKRMFSGALHDAAEMARAGVPTVMLFVQSLKGLSHTKEEDTRPEHLQLAVQALDRLASKTIGKVADKELENA